MLVSVKVVCFILMVECVICLANVLLLLCRVFFVDSPFEFHCVCF